MRACSCPLLPVLPDSGWKFLAFIIQPPPAIDPFPDIIPFSDIKDIFIAISPK